MPYASLTLIGHLALLWGLWQLYHSRIAIRWRLARNLEAIETWKKLEAKRCSSPRRYTIAFGIRLFFAAT
ncbi:MAG: hypothetical protein HC820_06155 [Hydrococcus sp. RM1_1_31]|nr:hypothetical protein [Hydrococcus sp. RM1_1_31]